MPIEILMPALSPTMTEGNLSKWNVKEGESVSAGQVIAEIETDKATMEVEAVDEGKIGKILVSAGSSQVKVNKCIALLLEEGESDDALKDYKVAEQEEEKEEEAEVKSESSNSKSSEDNTSQASAARKPNFFPNLELKERRVSSKNPASPLAKKIAQDSSINIDSVIGTGPRGRVVKEDVENYINKSGKISRIEDEYFTENINNMRKTIANRLVESKQWIPHFYLTVDCELDNLLQVRKDLNEEALDNPLGSGPRYKLTVNDLVIKAASLALRDVPEANASWAEEAIVKYNNIDISVAVAIDGGLITPIVKNADQKSLPFISKEIKELAQKAKDGKLQPHEYQGGGFSISNLGMYGVKHFNAIINPPQSSILAIGAGEKRPVVKNGELSVATVMTVTLSCDHRVVDGAVGAQLLSKFKNYIEQPVRMFV